MYTVSHNAKMTIWYKTNHLLDTFDYHFRTFFHTFLIHFQYLLQFEIEANAKPIIYAKY
jgi:hypothetical protein